MQDAYVRTTRYGDIMTPSFPILSSIFSVVRTGYLLKINYCSQLIKNEEK